MPRLTTKRIVLSILAVLLVWVGYTLALRISVTQFWDTITSPSVSTMVNKLNDPDAGVRSEAIGQLDYRHLQDPEVISALTGIAINKVHPYLQARAINQLASLQGGYISQNQAKPTLPQRTIDDVAALVLQDHDKEVFNALIQFLGNTAHWQTQAQLYLKRLTQLLEATEDKYVMGRILYALQSYARFHELPIETYDAVLKIYQNTDIQMGHTVQKASQVFYAVAHHQRFPDHVRIAIEQTLREHPHASSRRTAMFTLGNQSIYTDELSPALHAALDDPDKDVRAKAAWQIAHFKEEQGKKRGDHLATLLATARDTSLQASVRGNALSKATHHKLLEGISAEALVVAEEFLQDPQAELRAIGASHLTRMSVHPAYQQRQPAIQDWLHQALTDEQAMVRAAATSQLGYVRLDEAQRHDYLVTMLGDGDSKVVKAALRVVGVKKMDSPQIEAALSELVAGQDQSLHFTAKAQLQRIKEQRMSWLEKVASISQDEEAWGGLLFMLAAVAGILVALAFAVYYAYRLLDNAIQKSWRALTTVGVLMLWSAATYGMVILFVFGAFGMGHNTPAPLKDQLIIDAILFTGVMIFAGVGWLLHYLVRQPVKANVHEAV